MWRCLQPGLHSSICTVSYHAYQLSTVYPYSMRKASPRPGADRSMVEKWEDDRQRSQPECYEVTGPTAKGPSFHTYTLASIPEGPRRSYFVVLVRPLFITQRQRGRKVCSQKLKYAQNGCMCTFEGLKALREEKWDGPPAQAVIRSFSFAVS